MATVSVRGTAQASVRPDRAMISVQVSEVDRDPASALDRTVEGSRALEALLAELGVAAEEWTTSGVTVAEEREWRTDHQELVGYRATTTLQVTVHDLHKLGPLLGRAVTVARALVAGPWWRIDDDNPALVALLGAAALDARRRAEAYATALGLRLGEVEAISEQPFGSTPAAEPPMARLTMSAKAAPMAGDDEMPVNPGEVELSAEVHVRFALLSPR